MRLINVPEATNKQVPITVKVMDSGDYLIQANGVWRICDLSGYTKEATARQMADLLNQILAIGFNQGRAYVHRAMTGDIGV